MHFLTRLTTSRSSETVPSCSGSRLEEDQAFTGKKSGPSAPKSGKLTQFKTEYRKLKPPCENKITTGDPHAKTASSKRPARSVRRYEDQDQPRYSHLSQHNPSEDSDFRRA